MYANEDMELEREKMLRLVMEEGPEYYKSPYRTPRSSDRESDLEELEVLDLR